MKDLKINLEQAKHDRNTYNRMYQALKGDMAKLRGERDAVGDALEVTRHRCAFAEARLTVLLRAGRNLAASIEVARETSKNQREALREWNDAKSVITD